MSELTFRKFVLNVTPYGNLSKLFIEGEEQHGVERVQLDIGVNSASRLIVHYIAVGGDASGEVVVSGIGEGPYRRFAKVQP